MATMTIHYYSDDSFSSLLKSETVTVYVYGEDDPTPRCDTSAISPPPYVKCHHWESEDGLWTSETTYCNGFSSEAIADEPSLPSSIRVYPVGVTGPIEPGDVNGDGIFNVVVNLYDKDGSILRSYNDSATIETPAIYAPNHSDGDRAVEYWTYDGISVYPDDDIDVNQDDEQIDLYVGSWIFESCSISFDGLDGHIENDPSGKYKAGDVITIPNCIWDHKETREIYDVVLYNDGLVHDTLTSQDYNCEEFDYWYNYFDEDRWTPGDMFTVPSNTGEVTFYPSISEVQSDPDPVELPVLTKAGYKFKGWSIDPNDTNGVIGEYTPVRDSLITNLYAIWEEESSDNSIFVKTSLGFKKGASYVKVEGSWKKGIAIYTKVNNQWKINKKI